MKKIILGAVALLMLGACSSKQVEISGTIDLKDSTKAILNVIDPLARAPKPVDTTYVKDGGFSIEMEKIEPQLLLIFFDGLQEPLVTFGGNADITIKAQKDKFADASFEGGKETQLYNDFNQNVPGRTRMSEMQQEIMYAQMTGDTAKMADIRNEYMMLIEDQKAYVKKFVEANPDNAVGALYCMSLIQAENYSVAELKEKIAGFEKAIGEHPYVKEMKNMLEPLEKFEKAQKATEIGVVAPDFSLKSKDGAGITLSSLKGKYVLIDFWASWCAPCRNENPNVVKAYEKFSSKGFEVLGVSVDEDEQSWIKALEEDKLPWLNVRDADRLTSDIYGIEQIPTTFLLDKEGVIIAKNLRGEELVKKLEEVMK